MSNLGYKHHVYINKQKMMFSYLLQKYVKGNLIFHEVQLTYLRILSHWSLSTIPAPPENIKKP